VEWPKCKECGRSMQSKGWRTRQMETMVGIIH
jgi:tRNA(Ile2) C34 agmatinyltransferase TiaS